MGWRDGEIEIKTPEQIGADARAPGWWSADGLAAVRAAARARRHHRRPRRGGARGPSARPARPRRFLGYAPAFPAAICASVNDEVVHGIPGARVLDDGDLVSIDCGAIVDGWHGDAAITVAVGEVAPERLAPARRPPRTALWAGIAAGPGGRAAQRHRPRRRAARRAGRGRYGILEDYVGHGIGTEMHMDPHVPNYGRPGKGPRLVPGHGAGDRADGHPGVAPDRGCWPTTGPWSPGTARWAAHWEHTVAITTEGPWVLTAHDGGAERLAALGVASPAASRP